MARLVPDDLKEPAHIGPLEPAECGGARSVHRYERLTFVYDDDYNVRQP